MKKILVVAAHPDDEVLGCGGTIVRHVNEGDKVCVAFMSNGVNSRSQDDKSALSLRQSAAEKAQTILGINNAFYLDLPDNRMDSLPLLDVVKPLEDVVQDVRPDIIYTHHFGDLNIDHRITHKAVMTACRPQPGTRVRKIYTFEVMSSTEWTSHGLTPFIPNHYVDISDCLELKIQALNAYAVEMRELPHSRSIEHLRHLAYHRGCSVGVGAAEAFMLMRSIC